MLAISLEGSPEVNDLRRGTGVYAKVMHAMDLLKENGLIFGTSICYTSRNCESVTSKDFVKLMVDKGCRYAMYFHYMPVGNEASVELLPTPEQRSYIKDRIREIRRLENGEGLFTMDLQSPETAEHLCTKCEEYARNWKPCADKLWSETKVSPKSYENYKNK